MSVMPRRILPVKWIESIKDLSVIVAILFEYNVEEFQFFWRLP
jgi:hypothetical protein